MTAPPDLVAGRYRRERHVGSGGMGTVWEAWDELLDRRVALKQLHSPLGLSPEEAELANQRAMREARITARLSHRYAVPVFDVVEHEGRPCIVMPFIPAVTLTAVLREAGPLHPDEAAGVGAQVASALAAAHAAGIVHRDVKPGNILVADDGAALISDFGISHALGDVTLTSTGMVHGTPAYLAPEVARGGEATAASDVFSLGSTLYAAVEGTPPFGTDANSIGLLHRVAAADYPPPEQAGPLAPLLAEMLAPDPADRPSMGAVASRLKGLSGDAALGLKPGATSALASASVPSSTASSGGTGAVTFIGPGSRGPVAATSTQPEVLPAAADRRSRRRPARGLAAVVALVVAGVLAGLLWVQYGAPGGALARNGNLDNRQPGASATGDPSPGSAPPSTQAGSPPTSPAPGGDGSASPAPSVDTRPTTTPRPTPRRTTSAPATRTTTPAPTTRPPGSSSAGGPAGAVRNYYALMPSGTDAGWPLMTARYQRVQARSRATYEGFWGQFSRVTVSEVSSEASDRATATLTYYRKNGGVEVERTTFRFVQEDGRLKIDRSWLVGRGSG